MNKRPIISGGIVDVTRCPGSNYVLLTDDSWSDPAKTPAFMIVNFGGCMLTGSGQLVPHPGERLTPRKETQKMADTRDAKDYAIEFGRYLAKAARDYQRAINSDDIDHRDAWRALDSAIYEFEKRATRAEKGNDNG